jgi:hypothetical protein
MEKKRLCAMAQAPIRADFPRYVDMRAARRLVQQKRGTHHPRNGVPGRC